ncbi:dephospho-CoA kinase [Rubinisphaera sp. JC750]|uniref:dephospho-CoA kinase n=1 Tax=Rubinisphaera sp. JC750 TaxID=2898658 RepID=UPI001EEDD196|nr:dephospho-CoA kinase [Rubinisphaera sp. JC750]
MKPLDQRTPSEGGNTSHSAGTAEPEHFAVVGLVGGIGSGKSAVSSWVGNRLQIDVIDADKIGHQVLTEPEVIQQLTRRFGEQILGPDGEIQRPELGRLVWGDEPERQQARKDLEAISHPAIRREIQRRIARAKQSGDCGVFLDAAVMLETGWSSVCDRVVFIDTPAEIRQRRVEQTRGWSVEQWQARERSQWSTEDKRERADFVVDNSGSVDQAGQQLLSYCKTQFGWQTSARNPS